MKSLLGVMVIWVGMQLMASSAVGIDEEVFGESLGGWKKRSKQYAQYVISGTNYRTYRPESTITPDGGIYISMRIDHVRGWFSSDDHAVLEVTIDRSGEMVSAQSNIAIQGRSISSDVIKGVNEVGKKAPAGIDRAVQIGTDLVANLSSKLLREKIVEAGRVSFPSAVRHNYNLLFQAIRASGDARGDEAVAGQKPVRVQPQAKIEGELGGVVTVSHAAPLEIRSYTGLSDGVKKKK